MIPFEPVYEALASYAIAAVFDSGERCELTTAAERRLKRAVIGRLDDVATPSIAGHFQEERTNARRPGTLGFTRFCDDLIADEFERLRGTFPSLLPLIELTLANWVSATSEMLDRLDRDREAIEFTFGIDCHADVVDFETDLSDLHRGGRAVQVVCFGDGARLVYKPRDLRFEQAVFRCLQRIGEGACGESLTHINCLARGETHGYVSFIAYEPARTEAELQGFYRHAGQLLCALHVLGATDCHYENLIAHRDRLELIDAETLLEGEMHQRDDKAGRASLREGLLTGSVARTGLLPGWAPVGELQRSQDLSALGAEPAPVEPIRMPGWCDVNTDDMAWGWTQAQLPHPSCSPLPRGGTCRAPEFREEVLGGYREVYRWLLREDARDEVTGLVKACRSLRRRVVFRPTNIYVQILRESLNASSLSAEVGREQAFSKMDQAISSMEDSDEAKFNSLLVAERDALARLDVPYFDQATGSMSVESDGRSVVTNYYASDGVRRSTELIAGLSRERCEMDESVIRGSLIARALELGAFEFVHSEPDRFGSLDTTSALEALKRSAIATDDGGIDWLCLRMLPDARRLALAGIGDGLYDGRCGVAVYLFESGERAAATTAIAPVLDVIGGGGDGLSRMVRDQGLGYAGLGGILRAFLYLDERFPNVDDWRAYASILIAAAESAELDSQRGHDFLLGNAGMIRPSLRFYELTNDWRAESAARSAADACSKWALRRLDENGISRDTRADAPLLTGWSHGASGIAAALAHAWKSFAEPEHLQAATSLLRYEHELFNVAAQNWPDLRSGRTPADHAYMNSWCHGAPGVALSRNIVLEIAPDHEDAEIWRQDLDAAISTTSSGERFSVDHLCCGNLGRRVVAQLLTPNAELPPVSDRFRGLAPAEFTPGLMTGMAGLGMYELHGDDMRWADALLL